MLNFLSLGATTQFGQVQRLSVTAEQNDFGNLIYSSPVVADTDAVVSEGIVVDSDPYMRGVETFAEGGLACHTETDRNETFTWSLCPNVSGCHVSLGLYMKSTRLTEALFVHDFYVSPHLRDLSCSSTYSPCQSTVQQFDSGGLGIDFMRDGCMASVWFMAPYTTPDGLESYLGVYIKERPGLTPTMVNRFHIDTSTTLPIVSSDVDISRNFVYDDSIAYDPEDPPHLRPLWKVPLDSFFSVTANTTTKDEWYIGPYGVDDNLTISLAIYYRSASNEHYLVHIYSLDVLSIPALYTRFIDIYSDGGIAFSSGDSIWYFVSDTSDDVSSLGMYHRTSSGEPTMLHNFVVSDFPSTTVSDLPFRQGGVGTAVNTGTDVCTWFFAPITSDDGLTSVLGVYCMKTSATSPVLVHRYVIDLLDDPGVNIGGAPPPTDKSSVTLTEPYGNNADNPPHLRPIWSLPPGDALVLSSDPTFADSWYMAPTDVGVNGFGLFYKAASGSSYLVHVYSS